MRGVHTSKALEAEARVLLRYVSSGSGDPWDPSPEECELFSKAAEARGLGVCTLAPFVVRRPAALGPLDFATRIATPDCPLQKKLRIAAAIIECSPRSAAWLVPESQSNRELAFELTRLFGRILLKAVPAAPLLVFLRLKGGDGGR